MKSTSSFTHPSPPAGSGRGYPLLIKGATRARNHAGSRDFRPIRPNINNNVIFSGVNAGTDDPKASVPQRPIRPMSREKVSGPMFTGSQGLKRTDAVRLC
jgi:hypothetical protein